MYNVLTDMNRFLNFLVTLLKVYLYFLNTSQNYNEVHNFWVSTFSTYVAEKFFTCCTIKAFDIKKQIVIFRKDSDMITRNFVPFLLILFGTTSSFPSMFYGTSLQNKIKIAANELGIPEWKVWDTWLQFHTCKYSEPTTILDSSLLK